MIDGAHELIRESRTGQVGQLLAYSMWGGWFMVDPAAFEKMCENH